MVHSENFLTGRVFVLQTWDFWKHTNTALKDTPLRCDPTQISLLCRFIFFLCFSSGFLRTQWGFSIQITQKFGGKYQTVQLRWAVERKSYNSDVQEKPEQLWVLWAIWNLSVPAWSLDLIWLPQGLAFVSSCLISLFLDALAWGFNPMLFSHTDCRHTVHARLSLEMLEWGVWSIFFCVWTEGIYT